jgi:hypothetical protein
VRAADAVQSSRQGHASLDGRHSARHGLRSRTRDVIPQGQGPYPGRLHRGTGPIPPVSEPVALRPFPKAAPSSRPAGVRGAEQAGPVSRPSRRPRLHRGDPHASIYAGLNYARGLLEGRTFIEARRWSRNCPAARAPLAAFSKAAPSSRHTQGAVMTGSLAVLAAFSKAAPSSRRDTIGVEGDGSRTARGLLEGRAFIEAWRPRRCSRGVRPRGLLEGRAFIEASAAGT